MEGDGISVRATVDLGNKKANWDQYRQAPGHRGDV